MGEEERGQFGGAAHFVAVALGFWELRGVRDDGGEPSSEFLRRAAAQRVKRACHANNISTGFARVLQFQYERQDAIDALNDGLNP